jgi:hypothetical protein
MLLSHPVCIVSGMRISTLFRKSPVVSTCCAETDIACCRGTLVLHADGTVECDEQHVCGADEAQHELWVTCDELRCGCVGDDAPLEGWLLVA